MRKEIINKDLLEQIMNKSLEVERPSTVDYDIMINFESDEKRPKSDESSSGLGDILYYCCNV